MISPPIGNDTWEPIVGCGDLHSVSGTPHRPVLPGAVDPGSERRRGQASRQEGQIGRTDRRARSGSGRAGERPNLKRRTRRRPSAGGRETSGSGDRNRTCDHLITGARRRAASIASSMAWRYINQVFPPCFHRPCSEHSEPAETHGDGPCHPGISCSFALCPERYEPPIARGSEIRRPLRIQCQAGQNGQAIDEGRISEGGLDPGNSILAVI